MTFETSKREKLWKDKTGKFNGCYLKACLKRVDEASKDPNRLSFLQDLHFWSRRGSTVHLPDYKNPDTIAYYQLRFATAYEVEYYVMYCLALHFLGEKKNDYSVVSLGCGDGLDGLSLKLAASEMLSGRAVYTDRKEGKRWGGDPDRWLGIDVAKWGNPAEVPGIPVHDNVIEVLSEGATEYFKLFDDHNKPCNRNILFFPRVLCELDERIANSLATAISKATFSQDTILLCIANRTNVNRDDASVEERMNAMKVIEAFKENGYACVKENCPERLSDIGEFSESVRLVSRSESDLSVEYPCYYIVGEDGKPTKLRDIFKEGGKSIWIANDALDLLCPDKDDISNLSRRCPGLDPEDAWKCREECEHVDYRWGKLVCPLAVSPVTTTSQMNFQIIKLVRQR